MARIFCNSCDDITSADDYRKDQRLPCKIRTKMYLIFNIIRKNMLIFVTFAIKPRNINMAHKFNIRFKGAN